ncbi:DUF2934 domain-containing protein [Rhodospirillum centenum]|uniref:DUF2934 domain-containing protein n=1 Tax=Rhodospirillum centenum (strain ATCC 51521 / SW) TaxID=414684 RepID=B6IN16_RHOCS|nr:DUF2934 domain-containing protein [Rhodospirillum centenum]ACI98913.1 conserved hypothetical protein [Rhodospirillum centenum SW]
MDDLEKRISQRAYEIWEREGRPDGRQEEHWSRAREELLALAEFSTPGSVLEPVPEPGEDREAATTDAAPSPAETPRRRGRGSRSADPATMPGVHAPEPGAAERGTAPASRRAGRSRGGSGEAAGSMRPAEGNDGPVSDGGSPSPESEMAGAATGTRRTSRSRKSEA